MNDSTNSYLRARAEVIDLTIPFAINRSSQKALDGVVQIGKIASGCQIAQMDFIRGKGLGNDSWNDSPVALPGSVGIEGAHGK